MYQTEFNSPSTYQRVIEFTVDLIRPLNFDTIVVRGFSGALVGPPVALVMGKRWALVRKPNDGSHSCHRIEGRVEGNYVIVDDFIESGNTITEIVETVHNYCSQAHCLGVACYEAYWARNVHAHADQLEKIRSRCPVPILNFDTPAMNTEVRDIDFGVREPYPWMMRANEQRVWRAPMPKFQSVMP
jgi:adenine/guanine phosphoribosyltransferase-like PRPP-binding protein